MEARCISRFIRITPRKMRLVADVVRGKNVNEAINSLKFTTRSAALPVLKAIQSAVANLINSDDGKDVNADALFVKTIFVDEGPTMKRFMPRAMGRAAPIMKRTSHLTVFVATPVEPVPSEAEAEALAATPKAKTKPPSRKAVKAAVEAKVSAKAAPAKKAPAKITQSRPAKKK
jgi:large subunit ribosomal protein L22